MQDAKKAKEWASKIGYHPCSYEPEEVEAAKIILNLPDRWVDAEKVRELLDKWAVNPFPTSDEVAVLNDVEALLAPPLPALAELIEQGNDPAKYQWMQCRIGDTSRMGVITGYDEVGEFEYCTSVTFRDEADTWFDPSLVIPLPDLPRLEWPCGVEDALAILAAANHAEQEQDNV